MEYWTILVTIITGLYGIYYLFKYFNYFKRNGILHVPPLPIFGNIAPVIFHRISLVEHVQKLYYYKPDAMYSGFYLTTKPVILLRDPELIKEVLIKNFDIFPNRRGFNDIKNTLFSKNLLSLRGQEWRDMRTLLSPAFTANKIKTMYTLMTECAKDFVKAISKISDKSEMDTKKVFSRYANDVIATCAFGIKVDSMNDPTNKFYFYGRDVSGFIRNNRLKFLFLRSFPRLFRYLRLKLVSDNAIDFFKDTIKTTITSRDAQNIRRPDMIQLMMDMRDKHKDYKELSIDDMTAQAFAFFLGGFETTSTVMIFVFYMLAVYPDIQDKLRQEIDEVLKNSSEQVTYDVINRLEYLDAVINEVLRLYPPTHFVERVCEKTYELPPALPGEKSVVVKKGQLFWVPVYSIHRDEKYYDEPEKFRPERFLKKKVHHKSPYYLPFGIGPRMCIANRFALLMVKVLAFHLIAACEIESCTKIIFPVKLNTKRLDLTPENEIRLNIRHRSDIQLKIT